jgi:hypothetical protein
VPVVGFPEQRERGPEVRDWPLNRETIFSNEETGFSLSDETRFPLRGDWRTDFSPATWRRYATSSPRTVLSQQTRGDVQADLQPVAPEHLVLHAVRAPTRLIGRCLADPLRDLDRLSLIERATLPIERRFKAAVGAAFEPDVEGARQYPCGFRRQLDRHAVAHVGKCEQAGATMREAIDRSACPQLLAGFRQVLDPGTPPCSIIGMLLIRPDREQQVEQRLFYRVIEIAPAFELSPGSGPFRMARAVRTRSGQPASIQARIIRPS